MKKKEKEEEEKQSHLQINDDCQKCLSGRMIREQLTLIRLSV